MFNELLTSLLGLDPITADLIWTLTVSGLVLAAGAITLLMLPWSDREIAQVDHSFRTLATLPTRDAAVAARRS
ncbi:MAG: hypothetical protein VX265_13150 [Myxococcota bacterium]|nr:hypothetical protein [Myxococcota bacterium]